MNISPTNASVETKLAFCSTKVLLIGNNPLEMSAIHLHLDTYRQQGFEIIDAFSVEDSLKKIKSIHPDCIMIDDSLASSEIKRLMGELNSHWEDIPVTLLKKSNEEVFSYNGIQDFLLKEGLTMERLKNTLLNTIRFRKTHEYLYKSYKNRKEKVKGLINKKQGKLMHLLGLMRGRFTAG